MDNALIRKAAILLSLEAKATRESCMVGTKEWTCPDCKQPCSTKIHYEEMALTASKLLDMANATSTTKART